MKNKMLIIIPQLNLSNSFKKIIESFIPYIEVEIYPVSSEGKINAQDIIQNLEIIKKFKLILITSYLSCVPDNTDGMKLADILNQKLRNLKILILSFLIDSSKSQTHNISIFTFPYNLRLILTEILNLTKLDTEDITHPLPLNLQRNFEQLLHFLCHDFINAYITNRYFFREIYMLHEEWIAKIFKIAPNQRSIYKEDKVEVALNKMEEKFDSGESLKLYLKYLNNIEFNEHSTSDINERNEIFTLFLENTSEIINEMNRRGKSLFKMNEKDRASFSRKVALNFWLCWCVWKEFNFLEEYSIYFEKTFFRESFYTLCTFLGDEKFFSMRYKTKYKIENWSQFISLLNEKLNLIKSSFQSMIQSDS